MVNAFSGESLMGFIRRNDMGDDLSNKTTASFADTNLDKQAWQAAFIRV
jgi:hypothetical protein